MLQGQKQPSSPSSAFQQTNMRRLILIRQLALRKTEWRSALSLRSLQRNVAALTAACECIIYLSLVLLIWLGFSGFAVQAWILDLLVITRVGISEYPSEASRSWQIDRSVVSKVLSVPGSRLLPKVESTMARCLPSLCMDFSEKQFH